MVFETQLESFWMSVSSKIISLIKRITNTESTAHWTIVAASLYEKLDFET